MKHLKRLLYLMGDNDLPYGRRTARAMVIMWSTVTAVTLLAVGVQLLPEPNLWLVALNLIFCSFDVICLRLAIRKYRQAKAHEEREAWLRAMFIEWTR